MKNSIMVSQEKLNVLGYKLKDGYYVLKTKEGNIIYLKKDGEGLFLPIIRSAAWADKEEHWMKFFNNKHGIPCKAIEDDDFLEDFTKSIFNYIK